MAGTRADMGCRTAGNRYCRRRSCRRTMPRYPLLAREYARQRRRARRAAVRKRKALNLMNPSSTL